MVTDNYSWHLTDLRRLYVESLPEQRAKVAYDRLVNPDHDPNQLVTIVAAVEGFARSLAMHHKAKTKQQLSAIYPKYRFKSAEELLTEILHDHGGTTPSALFGEETWELFKYAVEYRNLLVHECTYLGQDRSPKLIGACAAIMAGLHERYQIPLPPAPPPAPAPTALEETAADDEDDSTDAGPPGSVNQMLKGMFDWAERMTNLLISAGYAGLLAAWSIMHEQMCAGTEFSIAILLVGSLSLFAFWHAFNMLRMNKAAFRYKRESQDRALASTAWKRFVLHIDNPHKPFEKFWVRYVMPATVYAALLGAVIMIVAFIHGLLLSYGLDLPICTK